MPATIAGSFGYVIGLSEATQFLFGEPTASMDIVTCPTVNQIALLLSGQLEPPLSVELNEHIAGCSRCSQSIQLLTASAPNNATLSSMEAAVRGQISSGDQVAAASGQALSGELSFLSPALGPDEIGWLSHYRVLKVLGEGGMGIVLLAEDTQLLRSVALKVIKSEFRHEEEVRQRFLREARAMAQLKSDHVITIHQVGQDKETCFIAMEFLEGQTLDRFLEAGIKSSLSETLRIGREICLGLAAAHAKGLIHRDIKPENVWLEAPAGRVKLLDFGLARPQKENVKLTMSGMIMGSPAYMSPEQARAAAVDERSDLFSLGCLLYELVSGKRPFDGDSVYALLLALAVENPQSLSEHEPQVPAALNDLIMRLLSKAPADRLQSAQEVIAHLEAIESNAPAPDLFDRTVIRSNNANTGYAPNSVWLSATGKSKALSRRQHPTREAERRQVTVLVSSCHLFQSEDYLEQMDDEEQSKTLLAFQEICEEAVGNQAGTIIQCNEEGFVACFGYPIAYEDASVRATNAALSIRQTLRLLSDYVLQERDVVLGPWLGLHTGPAILETKEDRVSLIGEARNIALRLKDVAESEHIVCSQPTYNLLRGKFDCQGIGTHKIKGMLQPVELFRVLAAIDAGSQIESKGRIELTPLTARDHELSLLKDRWEQAQEGMGQVVLLIGEAGLGKSRLVHTLKQHVSELAQNKKSKASRSTSSPDGATASKDSPIVEWYCSPQFRNTGLYPARNFFERLLNFERDEPVAARFDRLVQHLDHYNLATPDVVPLFAELLCLPTDSRFPSLALPPVRERQETFKALNDWLRAHSRQHSVLFIIEDLHWIDASTLEFLGHFLADGLHDQILSLLTFRPEFRTPWPALPHQTSLALNRLTKRQVGDLMRKKTGCDLPETVVDQIYDRAGGVPLFVEEFTKMVQESGLLDQTSDSGKRFKTLMTHQIPATLQDLTLARLDRIEGNREVAQLAATLGREFSYELLAALANLTDKMLEAKLAHLVQAEILYEKGRPPRSTYIFKHALLQDALYNSLIKDKRQQFHERIARALEARFPQIVKTQPELLAHHFTEAGLVQESIDYWLAAGLRSQEQFANVEAISHFTKGLELLPTLPESPARDLSELQLLNPLGSVYQAALGYAAPEVGPAFARARQLCEKTGQTTELFAIMWGNWSWHLVRSELQLCMKLADEMVALASATQERGMAMEAYLAPIVTMFYLGDFAGCRNYCKETIANYEDLEQCRIWSSHTGQNSAVHLRCYLSLALWHLGYPDRALQVNAEMLTLARQIEHPFSLAHALHFTGWFYQYCRLGDKVKAVGEEESAIAIEQGFALWQSTGTFFRGAGAFWQGDLEEALFLLEAGVNSFRAIAATLTLPSQLKVLADAYIKAGKLAQAGEALDEGLKLVDKHDDRSHQAELERVKGELLLLQGDQAAAESYFRKSIETARRQQSKAWELRATVSLARLWHKQGRRDEALSALRTIYGAYTEGLTMPDLVIARELLETLA
jgi:serine/threonine protein kinase/tetratricopeptide (TPR) repeat protein